MTQAAYRVIARQYADEPARLVYRTNDPENATCFAESYFINQHCVLVKALDERDRPIRDRNGRDFVWQRV